MRVLVIDFGRRLRMQEATSRLLWPCGLNGSLWGLSTELTSRIGGTLAPIEAMNSFRKPNAGSDRRVGSSLT